MIRKLICWLKGYHWWVEQRVYPYDEPYRGSSPVIVVHCCLCFKVWGDPTLPD